MCDVDVSIGVSDASSSDAGDWHIDDGEIEINSACTGLAGDLVVGDTDGNDAILDVNASFELPCSEVCAFRCDSEVQMSASFACGDCQCCAP